MLVVEDEWLVRMELAQTFEDVGSIVLEASSAETALDLLHAERGLELLVTDIRLNGDVSGWELARLARAANPEIAVIYLSANPPAPERYVAGGHFISKPALMRDVIEAADNLLQDRT